jgi:CheY-like chemotaxis protein
LGYDLPLKSISWYDILARINKLYWSLVMKMQKRIFTTLLSKLTSFRHYSFPLLISGEVTRSMGKPLLPRWFYRTRGDNSGYAWHVKHTRSEQHRQNEYLEDKDNQQQFIFSHVARSSALRVGILDDNRGILRLIESILTMEGHTVSKHINGSSLLAALSPQEAEELPPYDLVILDLLLPGTQSGADVFFAIRQRFSAEVLPIIVITAVDESTLKQFRHILPDDVPLLRKPFAPRKLRRLIAQLTGEEG